MCFRLDPDDTAEADSERLILAPPPEFRVCRHAHFVWHWHLIQDLVNARETLSMELCSQSKRAALLTPTSPVHRAKSSVSRLDF